ncbi:hypothetical protein Tco_1287349, partial [Tanacetum coccineum]
FLFDYSTAVFCWWRLKLGKMVKFTAHDLRKIMDKKDNIRNVCVIAHYGHGMLTVFVSKSVST